MSLVVFCHSGPTFSRRNDPPQADCLQIKFWIEELLMAAISNSAFVESEVKEENQQFLIVWTI